MNFIVSEYASVKPPTITAPPAVTPATPHATIPGSLDVVPSTIAVTAVVK